MVHAVRFIGPTVADPLRVGDVNPLLAALMAGGQSFCVASVAADGDGVVVDRTAAPDASPRWPRQCDHDTLLLDLPPERWQRFLEPGKRVVGAVQWPASRPPRGWVDTVNAHAQSCVVPSEWNRQVFADAGVHVPIHVVPRCEAAVPDDAGAASAATSGAAAATPWRVADVADDAYRFYAVLDFTERGNPAGLVKAYWCAFQRGERVALILHAARAGLGAKSGEAMLKALRRTREITRLPQYAPVHLVAGPLSSAALAGLHLLGDCFLSLARGWACGGPALDAAARGKPVLGTGYGGLGELIDSTTGYPVRYTLTPVSGMATEPAYTADQFWAEPDLAHAVELLRHLYANRDEARASGEALRRRVAAGCDPARAAAALGAAIDAAHAC
jgi:hypothetical protein